MIESSYLLIDVNVLPAVYKKVTEAKQMLATGKAKNASDAARQVGISRSAFYKYKDRVFNYSNKDMLKTIDLRAVLTDKAGVVSALTAVISKSGANILTVNQELPRNGTATISITLSTEGLKKSPETLIQSLKNTDGVISVTLL